MKILIVSQFYAPDITACAFRISETAKLLSEKGWEVHVIAALPHKTLINKDFNDGIVKVNRLPIIPYKGGGKASYLLHYLSFMAVAFIKGILNREKYDAIWVTSPPLFTAVAGYALALIKHCPICLDIRDLWPDSAVSAGQISENSLAYKAARIVEKFLYRRSTCITCVSKPMANHIKKITNKPVCIIYNGTEKKYINLEKVPFKDYDEVCLRYTGNIGRCQNISLLADAAFLLQERNVKGFRIEIIGDGAEKALIQNKIQENNLANIFIKPPVTKDEAMQLMIESDALLLHIKNDETMAKTVPSKLFDYMAAGTPILYGLKGEGAEILSKSGGNLAYDPDSPEDLADKIEFFLKNRQKLTKKARKNAKIALKRYTREAMTEKLMKFISNTVQRLVDGGQKRQ